MNFLLLAVVLVLVVLLLWQGVDHYGPPPGASRAVNTDETGADWSLFRQKTQATSQSVMANYCELGS